MAKPKNNPLDAAFARLDETPETTPAAAERAKEETTTTPKPRARKRAAAAKVEPERTVMIGAHLPPKYAQTLRIIAAEEETEHRALIAEALNLLFVKKGKARFK